MLCCRQTARSSAAVRAILLGVLLFVPLVAAAADDRRPNVLVLVADDQRPDTIHALGNKVIHTPNLDRLVRRGISFRRAVCANPICTPSRAEILTGCSGFRNKVLDFGGRIDPELATWPGQMRAHGYHAWYVGKWHNDGRPKQHGYEESDGLFASGGGRWAVDQQDWNDREVTGYRGWVFQQDDGTLLPDRGVGLQPDISRDFADAAIRFIRREVAQPFFLHVNFTAPHDPLLPPPGYESRYNPAQISLPANFLSEHPFDHGNFDGRDEQLLPWPRTESMIRRELAQYYAVISHMDEQIGRILEELETSGKAKDTIVVFTADHGLAVGSHGLRGKQNMYEHTIGVPLVIAAPGLPNGQRSDAQIYLRDLYPTVCELVGIPIPETVEGKSAAAVLRGDASQLHPEVFGYFRDSQRMIRTERWKLIHYPKIDRYQLFDLQTDPLERRDLFGSSASETVFHSLRDKLVRFQREHRDPSADSGGPSSASQTP